VTQEGSVVHGSGGLDKRGSVLIRIWVHRTHPLAGTAAGWRSFPIRTSDTPALAAGEEDW